MIKLNLGCGHNKKTGYINIDRYTSCTPDMTWDLEVVPWPFESNSVDEIIMSHSLEHMGATTEVFLSILKELYRVCTPGATILIAVPHPRSDQFAGDPTHVRVINPHVLSLFSRRNNLDWKRTGSANSPLGTYIDVDFETTSVNYLLAPHWAKKLQAGQLTPEEVDFAIDSYFNVVEEMKITLTVLKQEANTILAPAQTQVM